MNDFHGLPTAVLENETFRVEYLTTAGPRLVGLSFRGSPNLLADAHDVSWETPRGAYSLLGGHRLWIAPEIPERTYIPDGTGLRVRELPRGVELTGQHEPGSEVRKVLRVELDAARPCVQLVHTIVNESQDPITMAPWAITLFNVGGTVFLPQPVGNADPHGLRNNRLMALWPYTRIADPRLILRDDFIMIDTARSVPPLKIGYLDTAGWLAYWRDGILFRKSFDFQPGPSYPDGGCNAESYCNDRFVELESLGPLVTLAPAGEASLTETWEMFPTLDVSFLPQEICELVASAQTR
jgi:hypothetical protein